MEVTHSKQRRAELESKYYHYVSCVVSCEFVLDPRKRKNLSRSRMLPFFRIMTTYRDQKLNWSPKIRDPKKLILSLGIGSLTKD